MHLTFLGGAREVGASCALLEIQGKRILIDAGIRLTPQEDAPAGQRYLPKLGRIRQGGKAALDLVCITHAHADHMGAVPQVCREFPAVPLITSEGTFKLMCLMLPQSAELSERLAQETPGMRELTATHEEVIGALKRIHLAPFGKWFSPFADSGIQMAFFPAGHILGAAMVAIKGEGRTLVFTGDFSTARQKTVPGFEPFDFSPDLLVMEATYGCTTHAPREEQEAKLAQAIGRVLTQNGRVLIPAFSVGRSQEILSLLHRFMTEGRMPACPVYFDGLVRKTTACYVEAGVLAPFAPAGLIHPVASKDDRKAIIARQEPAVIVASSGNLAGGASVAYAQCLLRESNSAVFLSGYQDEESPGRALIEALTKTRILRLGDELVEVAAEVAFYQFSAHADGQELCRTVETLKPQVVALNHGEWQAELDLAKALREKRPVWLPDNRFMFDPFSTDLGVALRLQHVQAGQTVRSRIRKQGFPKSDRLTQVAVSAIPNTPATVSSPNHSPRHARHAVDYTLPELLAYVRPLQEVLGVQFRDEKWLLQALTHCSFLNESRVAGLEHNERLEFLGDAVIEYVITRQLMRRFPGVSEGHLTNIRALLVNATALAKIAERLGSVSYILTSRGERRAWENDPLSKARQIIMANTLEAIVGAIHEDRGLALAELFIADVLFPRLDQIIEEGVEIDPKSGFQELIQASGQGTPHFRIVSESGPDHAKWFVMECLINNEPVGKGEGRSKQDAEVAAATDALERVFGAKVQELRIKIGEGHGGWSKRNAPNFRVVQGGKGGGLS